MTLFVLTSFCFRAASSSSGIFQATYNSNCELGKSFSVLAQSCGARAFDNFVEIDCEDADADTLYCIEKGTADTLQRQVEKKVSSTTHLEELMDSMSTVSGSGWGVSLTASADFVSKNSASAHSVSFYKTSTGDSYEKKIKYTERLTLNDPAKEKLMRSPEEFVADYGTHFVSKIIYSNFFIGSVNIKQTSSESSASLGIMASLEVEKVFSGSASTTFNEAKESGSSYIDVTTDTSYNGPTIYVPADDLDAAEGVEDIFNQWRENVILAGSDEQEQYAKPTRMVFSQWTELEEVQAMFSDTGFPEALTKEGPSATLQDYLFRDTIRTNADINAIQNLLSWNCIGSTSSDMAIAIREIEAKLASHAILLEDMNEGTLADLELQVTNQDLTWFVGYTAQHIGEVNALLGESDQCKKVWISEDYTIYPWGQPRWGPVYNKLMMPEAGRDAFLRGFHFTAGRLNMVSIGVEGETIGYQVIESEVNGGNMHQTSNSVWKHYDGADDLSSQKTFELTCAKEGMYVAGIHVDWSEVLCACATPNTGYSGNNQRQCTDGSVTWCSSNEQCTIEQAYKKRNINYLCGSRRRVSDPLRRLEDEIDAYGLTDFDDLEDSITVGNSDADGDDYGRVISMTVHCVPLPKGNYGLPSGSATTHGPYTLKNQASTRASKDCPDGSAIFHVDWMGVARAKNDDTSQTENDAAWTIASEIEFYCRDFADFMA